MLNAIPSPENAPKKLKMRKMLVSMQVSLMLRLLMSSQKLWRNIPLKNWLQNTGTALGMSLPTTGSCQFPLSKGREKLSAYVLYVGTLLYIKNNWEIPDQILNNKDFSAGQSAFGISAGMTLQVTQARPIKSHYTICPPCMISH